MCTHSVLDVNNITKSNPKSILLSGKYPFFSSIQENEKYEIHHEHQSQNLKGRIELKVTLDWRMFGAKVFAHH
jgi:hypothetical protein